MVSTFTIKIKTEKGEREIYISPFLLQSPPTNVKSGTITVCRIYFYDQLKDDDYINGVKQEFPQYLDSDKYVINYGQDFEKYYLGSLYIDFETKSYSDWEGKHDGLDQVEIKALGDALFDEQSIRKSIVLFTPTRPSDFNLGKLQYPI